MVTEILKLVYLVLIGPLQLLFEFLFSISYDLTRNAGISIIILSIAMNLLALPLYRRADALQNEQAEKLKAVSGWQERIRKTFKGDERFMMLNAFNREKGIRPTDALKGSASLLLEIPFFIAAYKMLSSLALLSGKSFGPIKDMGAPDGLINIGVISVNVLPLLMTAINILSSSIYLKDSDRKSKIQLYGIAAIFLILLYNSPSGLVFYWTCNNIFSLVKNILLKDRKPKMRKKSEGLVAGHGAFIASAAFNALLVGLFIPSNTIKSSPAEFTEMYRFVNPALYLRYPLALAVGSFIVWVGVFYLLSSTGGKEIITMISFGLAFLFTLDYTFLKVDYGNLFGGLFYSGAQSMSNTSYLPITIAMVMLVFASTYLILKRKRDVILYVSLAAVIVLSIMGIRNVADITRQIKDYEYIKNETDLAEISLNRNGKNVIVIMLDRALGYAVPYIFNELPYLQEQFSGFTYYPNTLSFGAHTNTGSPALYGGYEYTPSAMNARADMSIADKHDEALKVLPVLFYEEGAEVTLCDPSYAGYKEIPDLRIFDEYPGMKTYITNGRYNDLKTEQLDEIETVYERNLFCYSLFRAMPPCLHGLFYDNGRYNNADYRNDYRFFNIYDVGGHMMAGYSSDFLDSVSVLDALPDITEINDDKSLSYTLLVNDTAHSECMLQEPFYRPSDFVDNREYDEENADRFILDGKQIHIETSLQLSMYQVNAAAYIELGEWFDYLRQQGIYDNTRIIIVSDHAYGLHAVPGMFNDDLDASYFNPVLMVKDFDSEGFSVSEELMTNADTPALALSGIIEDPVNPFTGAAIDSSAKDDDLLIFASNEYYISKNNGYTFIPGPWYSVSADIRNVDNWTYEGEW